MVMWVWEFAKNREELQLNSCAVFAVKEEVDGALGIAVA